MERSSRRRRHALRGRILLLVPALAMVFAVVHFALAGAHASQEITLPPPGLPDLSFDESARYQRYLEDGQLSAARVGPAFDSIRDRFDGMRVIFVPSYLSDTVIPTVSLGARLGYMAGIYNWLAEEGIDAEIADVETEDTVSANAMRLHRIVGDGDESICFVTHSKGGLDVLEYLRRLPVSDRARVKCWVAMQVPFAGSPVADLVRQVPGLPQVVDAVLPVLGGNGESLVDLTTDVRRDYLVDHAGEIAAIFSAIPTLCLATHVVDPSNFEKPTSWSYPALVWMHDNDIPSDGLVPVRSAVEICPRSLIVEDIDHTGIVSPGIVAPIDQTALMRLLFTMVLD